MYPNAARGRGYHSVKYVKRSALDCFTVVACEKRAAVGEFRAMEYVKRGALDCFMVVACEKGAAVGAYHGMGYEKRGALDCFTVVEYEKHAALGACLWMGYEKRGALDCFMVVEYEKRIAFSCPRVGAYCIRPTNVPFMGRMIQMIDCRCAFLSPVGPFGGAYAIRPYRVTRKMIALGMCYWVEYERRGAMPAFYCLTWRRSYTCDLLL